MSLFLFLIVVMASIRESIVRGYNGRAITIFTDSQAALKSLESVIDKFKFLSWFSNAWDASVN